MSDYIISKNGKYMTFIRDHGECYGGEHKSVLDTYDLKGMALYDHIEEYLGKAPALAAERQGFCYE
jgi:hypothetical protein